MTFVDRLMQDDMRGIHYAVSLAIATTVLWILMNKVLGVSEIWAVSSMVATSDPQVKEALATFRGRIVNTVLGCAVGLLAVALGHTDWRLPFSMAVTVLLSTYVVRVQAMWRQAPITAAIVIAASLEHHDKATGMHQGLMRVGEVIIGCLIGILVAWVMSRVWPLPEVRAHAAAK
jgi:uncharacterized membrane protein YccC